MTVLDLRDGADPLRSLTGQLIDTADRPDREKRFGVYYLPSASEFAPLGRFVEREVFLARFGNDDQTMHEEYGPFEVRSDFVVCVDHSAREPSGVLRLIRPGPDGLKTMIDVASEPRWGVDESAFLDAHHPPKGMAGVHDIATFAVRAGWTESAALIATSHALYAGLYRWSVANEVDLLIGAIDETVAALIKALAVPMEPLCGLPAIEYLGSVATRPYVISVLETRRRMRVDAGLRALMTGAEVERDFSFPAVELDAPSPDLQAELTRPRQALEAPSSPTR